MPEMDISLLLTFLEIEYTIRKAHYGTALQLIEQAAAAFATNDTTFDVQSQVKLLCLKARIFEKKGQSQRGFSLAMKAVRIAYRSRLLPGLWEAVCSLAAVLLGLGEFPATLALVESVMPQILETEDAELAARGYSLLVDAKMGLAGRSNNKKELVNHALGYIDAAYEQYEEIEDIVGQCEMMAKKSIAMLHTGDLVLADDCAAKYLDLQWQGAESM